MSDETRDVLEHLNEDMAKAEELGKKQEKIKEFKVNQQIKRIERTEKRMNVLEGLDLSQAFGEEHYEQMDKAQDQRVESFSKRLPFIHPILTQMINLAAQELIFIGAKSGRGKSTTIANIILPLINAKPVRKILVISNEEKAESVLNRVICLIKGWNINDFKNFTKEQLEILKKLRRVLGKYVHVIDQDFTMLKNAVLTIEGVEAILEKAISDNYDVILMDYYQKFSKSEENPMANKVSVLTDLSEFLDGYVKRSPAPVVMMGQLKTESKDRQEFEDRIKESKSIYQNATQSIEMITDKDKLKTVFIKRKDRWDQRDNLAVETGFDRGRYVEYTKEFESRTAHRQILQAQNEEAQELLGSVGNKEE